MNRHRFSSHNVSDTRCIYKFFISNYYSRRICIVTLLDIWRFDVIEWNYSRYIITINVNNIKRIIVVNFAYYHKIIKFINENDNRIVIAKLLFRLFLCTKFSHDVAFIQYYNYPLRSFLWFELCTRIVDQKSF